MLISFIIFGSLFTLVGGWMFGLMFVGGMPEKGEWGKKIIATIISLVVGFGIAGMIHLEALGYQKAWNDGVCPDCGVEWRFANADHHRHGGTTYYYVCDNCGKIIEQGS